MKNTKQDPKNLMKSLERSKAQVKTLKDRLQKDTFIIGLLIALLITMMSMVVYMIWN